MRIAIIMMVIIVLGHLEHTRSFTCIFSLNYPTTIKIVQDDLNFTNEDIELKESKSPTEDHTASKV